MKYESSILKRLIDTYGVVGKPQYISEIIKEFIVRGKERFPNLFTYQSDWLAHIDEFGLNPSYAVSYTGQSIYAPNTLERPVKSAILKGQTLVNLLKVNKDNYVFNQPQNWSIEDGYFKCVSTTSWHTVTDRFNNMIKPSTKYLIVVEIKENTLNIDVKFDGYGTALNSSTTYLSFNSNEVGIKKVVITTPSTIDSTKNGLFRMPINAPNEGSILKFRVMAIEYQDGMENWDIPYFEGMKSVKMPVLTTTGKNLLDITPNTLERITINGSTGVITEGNTRCTTKYIKATPKDDLFLKRFNTDYKVAVRYYHNDMLVNRGLNGQGNFINDGNIRVSSNDYYNQIRLIIAKKDDSEITPQEVSSQQIMLTRSQSDVFEPYKSNILSCLEPVELGSVGEVKDELNLLTQQLTQRTETRPYQEGDELNSEFVADMTNTRYKLAQEVVKTVDLNILDQNGQNIKQLMSFNDGTHFITGSAEGSPLPVVSVSVETDLEETLRVCSLEGNTL